MSDDEKQLLSDKLGALIFGQLAQFTHQLASGAEAVSKSANTMASLWGDGWVKEVLLKSADPERLKAMADAGSFLKDAREVAGLNIDEMATALGLKDTDLIEQVESGEKLLPFEYIFRVASLLARHDPIPFIIKFLRTYNPALEQKLEAWNLIALPKQFERERRFINIYRQHDELRNLSDEEFDRLIDYSEKSLAMVLEIMNKEKVAAQPAKKKNPRKAKKKAATKKAASSRKK